MNKIVEYGYPMGPPLCGIVTFAGNTSMKEYKRDILPGIKKCVKIELEELKTKLRKNGKIISVRWKSMRHSRDGKFVSGVVIRVNEKIA